VNKDEYNYNVGCDPHPTLYVICVLTSCGTAFFY